MALYNKKQNQQRASAQQRWSSVPDETFAKFGISREQLTQMQSQFMGTIVLPDDPEYNKDRQGNPLYPAFPQIIAYCEAPSDVSLCLEWAHKYGWWVTCRSGGHCTAGYSVNSGMVIDVSRMAYVAVQPERMVALVGSGTSFAMLNSVLNSFKLHTVTGGCDTVGVGGFTQGGGYGFTSREYGMGSDNVVSAQVMLYNGRIVEASLKTNPDLWYAIRGGTGNNFGVVLEFTFQLHKLHDVWGFCLQWPLAAAPSALFELQSNYMKSGAPDQVGYQCALATLKGQPVLVMMGMFHGSRNDGMQAINSLRKISNPTFLMDKVGSYQELNAALIDGILPGIPDPAPGDNVYEVKHAGYVARPMSLGDWREVCAFYKSTPNPYNIAVIEAYGGAINRYPVNDSAFVHRDAYMDFFVDSFWEDKWGYNDGAEARAWLAKYMEIMAPHVNGHMYQNYPIRGYTDYRWAYWGDAFPSLLAIKQKYDPDDFFHFEQSISPYPAGSEITRSSSASRFNDPKITYLE